MRHWITSELHPPTAQLGVRMRDGQTAMGLVGTLEEEVAVFDTADHLVRSGALDFP